MKESLGDPGVLSFYNSKNMQSVLYQLLLCDKMSTMSKATKFKWKLEQR